MCVVAHPDDECFAFGGALALYADRSVETYVVCLTDGSAGSHRGGADSHEELGGMRREEFAASCEVLGVTHHEVLDYEDGRLEFVEFSQVASQLVERMRRIRPQVVLTFGGDGGMNTHADHMMASALATAAFHWSGHARRFTELGEPHQAERLFYVTTDVFLPGRPAPKPMPWTVELDIRSVKEQKAQAFLKHVSQAPLIEQTRAFFEQHGDRELYALAASGEAQQARMGTDLFEGVR
jgi:LmbE family N-acetylglucosaminyl deacetylase